MGDEMNQLSLFNPIARRNDPLSSHLAAREVIHDGTRNKQASIILDLVRRYPGKTSLELSQVCDLDRYQIACRLSDLEHAGEVEKGRIRICEVAGRMAVTWKARE
jgi:hypothetical protein